jgi:hypothetical protein
VSQYLDIIRDVARQAAITDRWDHKVSYQEFHFQECLVDAIMWCAVGNIQQRSNQLMRQRHKTIALHWLLQD